MPPPAILNRLASVPAYFALRVASGLLLLKLSASFLPVSGFTVFAQFMLFAALLNMVAVGGTQNGLIRQAAAARDDEALIRTEGAALAIWAMAAPLLLIPIAVGSSHISNVLVDTRENWLVVIVIATIALTAGPGQVWCSILSGRTRVAQSLASQATGLLTSTLLAGWLITRGQPIAAAIGFASGSLVTMAAAFLFASRLRIPFARPRFARAEIKTLVHYSAAFVATAGFTSIILFGLRSIYRDEFGATWLGYWMAANRVSDMSTQLLGLFMIQFFVPHTAPIANDTQRRHFAVRCWAAGLAIMALALATFSVASVPIIHIFLSDAFIPAIPVIQTYMFGDILRVWTTLAMYTAFASGRPGRYAAIEIGTLATMGAVTLALISAGDARAPQFGYAGAHAVVATIITVIFVWRALAEPLRERSRRRAARRTLHRGSAELQSAPVP